MNLGLLIIGDGSLTIDNHRVVAAGLLNPAPLVAWQVLDHLVGADREALWVLDHNVGRATGPKHAAVLEPGKVGR